MPVLTLSRAALTVMILTGSLTLSGCKSAEDRAEDYYQSGLTLLESGDEDRAMLEFRNVFDYDGFHKDARQTYADLLLSRGDVGLAYAQYLRLIEQYPDTLSVRLQLAEIAVDRGDWPEAQRHGEAAIALAPKDPRADSLGMVLRYHRAMIDGDTTAIAAIAQEARTRLASQGAAGRAGLIRIDLDDRMNSGDTAGALVAADAALVQDPEAMDLNLIKAQLLVQGGDMPAIGQQLEKMAALFPDDQDVRQNLIRWYVSQNDTAGAVAYLRDLAGPQTNDAVGGHLTVVDFLRSTQGPDAARAELIHLRDANAETPNGGLYAGTLAALDFETGQTESGIAQMRAVLEDATPSNETRKLQIMLAQMLNLTDARPAAEAIVTAVLAEDSSNVEALKLQAGWLISEDKVGQAIIALRTALNQNPQDSKTLTLMAQAHQRDGDFALAGERLALAVQVSNAAPAESLRYAGFLAGRDQTTVAITVLDDARRQSPGDVDVLTGLADLYLQNRDWALAQRVVDALRKIGTDPARTAAALLQAAILQGQNRTSDSLAVLETQVDPTATITDHDSTRAVALILQTQIRGGKITEARTYLSNLLSRAPDNANLQMLDASLSSLEGDTKAAEDKYRALARRFPDSTLPARFLIGVLMAEGRTAEATEVIDTTLPLVADATPLLLIKASMLEKAGEVDAAIAVHEQMYAQNSDSTVIANNLASMIASFRDDDASLVRATTIARRLRGTTVPAFADTYGWIAYRRGNIEEALTYLVPAAAGLPDDAMVQLHLGMAYAAAAKIDPAQTDKAHTALTRAIKMSAGSTLPQFQIATQTLAALSEVTPPTL